MKRTYAGVLNDDNGGLTPLGKVVMDAWVFELLPEEQTCAGWDLGRMQQIYDQVHKAWEAYGHLPSRLPEAMQERHQRIYAAALERARQIGWSPEKEFGE